MFRSLWQLLLAGPSSLRCDECFTVMEHFAGILAGSGNAPLPEIQKFLAGCPDCTVEHRMPLGRLAATQSKKETPATSSVTEPTERGNS